ncbi:MAG: hypothetical protein EAZ92_11210 [Candidatus Kapaibacterium sp.]|nr:MAG: hypothetical protein EAZ92_11210 [Candidatus Kapabacteria bacterium]
MKTFILIFLALLSIEKLTAQQTWKLAKDEDGIKVVVSEVSNSEYYAFKAIMSVKTTEAEIIKKLKDVQKYPEWFAFTASTRLLAQSENEQSFFMETDYPWPFSNECMNYQMVFEKLQDNVMKVSINGTNTHVQCEYSLKKASGYILLEPENGAIKMTYYFHSEASQNIPPWLINPRIHEMPYQTFKALRKKLNS